jgi:hypothetical protein
MAMSPRPALITLLVLVPLLGCASDDDGSTTAPVAPREAPANRPAAPLPEAPIPSRPGPVAERLRETRDSLYGAIDRWLAEGDPRGRTPREVTLHALDQQRIYVALARRERLGRAVIARLGGAPPLPRRPPAGASARGRRSRPAYFSPTTARRGGGSAFPGATWPL